MTTTKLQQIYTTIVDSVITGQDTQQLINQAIDIKFSELAVASGITQAAIDYVTAAIDPPTS